MILDSASSINIIKRSSVPDNIIDYSTIRHLEGISKNSSFKSLGLITALNYNYRGNISFIFHVVNDEDIILPEPIEGLLGLESLGTSDISFANKIIKLENKISFEIFPLKTLINSIKIDNNIDKFKDEYENSFVFQLSSNRNADVCLTSRLDKILNLINIKHLDKDQYNSFKELLTKFTLIFFLEGDKLRGTNLIEHRIVTLNDRPVFTRQYRTPPHLQQEIKTQIDNMLKEETIEFCTKSDFNNPIFLVPKARTCLTDKLTYRLVVNFQKLNENVAADIFPLPIIDDIIFGLKGNEIFSVLDTRSGYHQIPLSADCRHMTAFSLNNNKYQFKKLPMGLIDSGFTFQRLLNKVLNDLIGKTVFVFIDDIIVFSKSTTSHILDLEEVFQRLSKANLKLSPKKCQLLTNEVEYLGHIIRPNGFLPNERKIDAIRDFHQPKSSKDVKSFLGLASYYRKFINNFASIASGLNSLLKKGKIFEFDERAKLSFEILKEKLTSPPLLMYPDFSKPFILTTDASNTGLGAVLTQINEDGKEHPIAYASRSLNTTEAKYSTFDRELLAIVWAISKHFRSFLYGRKFIVYCDHLPLISLLSGRLDNGTARLVRWKLLLLEFDFKIIHKKGKLNVTADFLSRINKNPSKQFIISNDEIRDKQTNDIKKLENQGEKFMIFAITRSSSKIENEEITLKYLDFIAKTREKSNFFLPPFIKETDKEIQFCKTNHLKVIFSSKSQQDLPQELNALFRAKMFELGNVYQEENFAVLIYKNFPSEKLDTKLLFQLLYLLRIKILPNKYPKIEFQILKNEIEIHYLIFIQILNFLFKLDNIQILIYLDKAKKVESNEEKQKLLKLYHANIISGHSGIQGTYNRIKKHYFWNGMKSDIEKLIKTCDKCQLHKNTIKKSVPLAVTPTSTTQFEKVSIDLVGPLPETEEGNKFLFTCQDDLSKYLIAIPIPNSEAITVANIFVTQVILVYSTPTYAISDNGVQFLSNIFKEVCKLFHIKRLFTTPYHPQSNFVERSHSSIKTYLKIFMDNNKNWDQLMPYCVFNFNTRVNESTGFSPFTIIFGKEAKLPYENTEKAPIIYTYDDFVENLKFTLKKVAFEARKSAHEAKEKRKIRFDKNAAPFECQIGDLVKVRGNFNPIGGKFDKNKFKGPYTVLENNSEQYVTLLIDGKKKKYHKNNIAKFYVNEENNE